MSDKVVVSNDSALRAKYGSAGVKKIRAAVRRLIVADAARGLSTQYVALDDARAMKKLAAQRVTDREDPEANKVAIDGVYGALIPDYLMILGSVDVIPHQVLRNPLFDGDPLNEDRAIPSDLPYACIAPWSDDVSDFIAPTRVVARLPDLTGARKPDFMLTALGHATSPTRLSAAKATPFGLTARVWRRSTIRTLDQLFDVEGARYSSPDKGPQWTAADLKHSVHFINCHGSRRSPQFFGQPTAVSNDFPVAHDAVLLTRQIQGGTVAAAECCYGAELYDPKRARGRAGIGYTYLECGANAFLGSTTIAYGPATTNNHADVICRLFIEELLSGRSSGDALLSARLEYAKVCKPIDPYDLKTLGQFILLGDPSIRPFTGSRSKKKRGAKSAATKAGAGHTGPERKARREMARSKARELELSASVTSRRCAIPSAIKAMLKARLKKVTGEKTTALSFGERGGVIVPRLASGAKSKQPRPPDRYRTHILYARQRPKGGKRFNYPVAVVATERNNKVVHVETVYGK